MKKEYLLFAIPLGLLINLYVLSWITELVSQPSDVAVLVGVFSLCILLLTNYFIYKLIKTKTK